MLYETDEAKEYLHTYYKVLQRPSRDYVKTNRLIQIKDRQSKQLLCGLVVENLPLDFASIQRNDSTECAKTSKDIVTNKFLCRYLMNSLT